ncbi:hypothetical protein Rrhod_2878 [Rhodococcus rhodnii LMG 5362]|uniref:Uncharacterized protein n=1 Tax=Rhodococcus rhodnii LMG 5362 TaxID=1273125 RepID=R7WKK3_9NOCA|nr:hypothetical protein Rrhod_2878 [Rhodococcus rhodnii LMG 5362]
MFPRGFDALGDPRESGGSARAVADLHLYYERW